MLAGYSAECPGAFVEEEELVGFDSADYEAGGDGWAKAGTMEHAQGGAGSAEAACGDGHRPQDPSGPGRPWRTPPGASRAK